LFGYGVLWFGLTNAMVGFFLISLFLASGFVVVLGSQCIPAKLGSMLLVWLQLFWSLIAMLGPGKPLTLWLPVPLMTFGFLGASFVNAMFFGQVSAKRRGELTSLFGMADRLGNLFGLFLITPVNVYWIRDYLKTGISNGLTPPMVQVGFDICAIFLFYFARIVLRKQDKFGLFVLRCPEEEEDAAKTAMEASEEVRRAGTATEQAFQSSPRSGSGPPT